MKGSKSEKKKQPPAPPQYGRLGQLIKREHINLRHIAAKLGTTESILRFHLRREPTGEMNPEFESKLETALQAYALEIIAGIIRASIPLPGKQKPRPQTEP